MRRVTAAISNFVDVGDVTTLANPEVVDEIKTSVQRMKLAAGDVPANVAKEMQEEVQRFGEDG